LRVGELRVDRRKDFSAAVVVAGDQNKTMNELVKTEKVLAVMPDVSEIAARVTDPVIRRKARELARALKVGQQFKRIDMAFLQMVGLEGIPRFAILPLPLYRAGAVCEWTGGCYKWFAAAGSEVRAFGELFRNFTGSATAVPELQIPQSVEAVIDEVQAEFDELFVAWEAKWQVRKGDPLVIGRIGPDLYFLLASWDTTSLETYVVSGV
jgi:hypothetical protein